jgi:hypothetical protein
MFKHVYCVDVGRYFTKDFSIVRNSVVKARRIDEMDFVFDVIMLITQDIILNILGDYSNRLVMSTVFFIDECFLGTYLRPYHPALQLVSYRPLLLLI